MTQTLENGRKFTRLRVGKDNKSMYKTWQWSEASKDFLEVLVRHFPALLGTEWSNAEHRLCTRPGNHIIDPLDSLRARRML